MELLGACCFLVAGLLGVGLWMASAFAHPSKRFYTVWVGVPALGLVVLISLAFALWFYHSLPGVIFKQAVGFAPTEDVIFIYSFRRTGADWDDSYLAFYASDDTISLILDGRFAQIPRKDIIEYAEQPKWWDPPAGLSTRIYATNTKDPLFHNKDFRYFVSHVLLIYDPESGAPGKRKVYLRYRPP